MIPEAAVDRLATSIEKFGWRQPIVIDEEGVIIVGHTRLLAAQKLGLKKVPVHVASELSDTEAAAYRLADNRTGELTSWDFEPLGDQLSKLNELDFDMGGLGFSEEEWLAPEAAEFEVPAPPGAEPDEDDPMQRVTFQVRKSRMREFQDEVMPIHKKYS